MSDHHSVEVAYHVLVNEISVLSLIDSYRVRLGLPVGRKDNHRLGLDLLCDLATDLLKHGIHRMLGIVLDSWLWKDR